MNIPSEIYDWVIEVFRNCNIRLSEKLLNNPHRHEEHLDHEEIQRRENHQSSAGNTRAPNRVSIAGGTNSAA